MSSRQYTVTINLKDSNNVLKKMEGLNGRSGGGARAGATTSGGGVLQKIQSLNISQLAVLGGIGLSIGFVANQMVKSSGLLQQQFKLWETSMSLIFRPIADFFGSIMRPVMMALLGNLIIPFYQAAFPWFREHGRKLGEDIAVLVKQVTPAMLETLKGIFEVIPGIAKGILDVTPDMLETIQKLLDVTKTDIVPLATRLGPAMLDTLRGILDVTKVTAESIGALTDPIKNLGKADPKRADVQLFEFWRKMAGLFSKAGRELNEALIGVPQKIVAVFTHFGQTLGNHLVKIPSNIAQFFTDLGTSIRDHLVAIPPFISKLFLDFGMNVWNWLVSIPPFIGGLFTTFGQNLWNAITGIPAMIGGVFDGLVSGLSGIIQDILNKLRGLAMAIVGETEPIAPRLQGHPRLSGSSGSTTPVAPAIRRAQLRTQIAGIADSLG